MRGCVGCVPTGETYHLSALAEKNIILSGHSVWRLQLLMLGSAKWYTSGGSNRTVQHTWRYQLCISTHGFVSVNIWGSWGECGGMTFDIKVDNDSRIRGLLIIPWTSIRTMYRHITNNNPHIYKICLQVLQNIHRFIYKLNRHYRILLQM